MLFHNALMCVMESLLKLKCVQLITFNVDLEDKWWIQTSFFPWVVHCWREKSLKKNY